MLQCHQLKQQLHRKPVHTHERSSQHKSNSNAVTCLQHGSSSNRGPIWYTQSRAHPCCSTQPQLTLALLAVATSVKHTCIAPQHSNADAPHHTHCHTKTPLAELLHKHRNIICISTPAGSTSCCLLPCTHCNIFCICRIDTGTPALMTPSR